MNINRLKWATILSFVVAMSVLLAGGFFAGKHVAPYPGNVTNAGREVLFTKASILAGQDVYQKYGLMDHGSVWGHGSQRGMEFSAVTLRVVGDAIRDTIAQRDYSKLYNLLSPMEQQIVDVKVTEEVKTNRYNVELDTLFLTEAQVKGAKAVEEFWEETFRAGQKDYGFLPNTVPTAEERKEIAQFFFWTAWVASVKRPGENYSYTNNWPHDRSIGNVPSLETYIWTIAGILSLFITLGIFIYLVHYYRLWYGEAVSISLADKLVDMPLTNSQLRAAKFFLVVILLFLLQTCCGGLLAHYTVHPASFYLQAIADHIPYSWAKSWHLQLAIFWIATTWVASAIYIVPIVGGREPRKQGLLVQLLFAAIVLVAVGSLAGEVAGIKGLLGKWWYWFGHQGWEYLELGRIWQILLFVGLIFWLLIIARPIAHYLLPGGKKNSFTGLVSFYAISAIAVVGFFGFGLCYGHGTHLTVADYWRWFVVHIWVESIFEFFGVAAISLLLVVMGLVSARSALAVSYFTAILMFLSGIIGTAHHYYWYGGPSYWLALGSVFSSIEPVPLFGLIVRALIEYRSIRHHGQEFKYKWPMYFLVASSFWNFLGAAVFGFLINLPIINYYEHGTYLTMNHGHAALFGVYGMLSIALLLFSWRGLVDKLHWNDKILKVSFWGFNLGLAGMTFVTLFPVGIAQAWTCFEHGLWVARSAEFFNSGFVSFLGQIRIIPDTVIIVCGVLPLVYFLFTTYPHLKAAEIKEGESVWQRIGVDMQALEDEKK
jgi:nitric oxide reductase subunit B